MGDLRTSSSSAVGAEGNQVILRAGVASVAAPNVPLTVDGATFEVGAVADQSPGSIVVGSINTSNTTGGDGGLIILSASGDITITGSFEDPFGQPVALGSFSFSDDGNAGTGGDISLNAGGDIETDGLSSASTSYWGFEPNLWLVPPSDSDSGNAGPGGDISLNAGGDIETGSLSSESWSYSGNAGPGGDISLNAGDDIETTWQVSSTSSSNSGNAGPGGDISLNAGGDIETTREVGSTSSSNSGNARNGGGISLNAGGNITTNGNLQSFSLSESGNAGTGGAISLLTRDGFIRGSNTQVITLAATEERGTTGEGGMTTLEANAISGLEVITLSSAGQSGDVEIQGFGESLVVSDLSLTTSALLVITLPNSRTITLDTRDIGQSGDTFITSAGNLTLQEVVIQSDANGDNPAGNIFVNSAGEINLTNSEISVNTNSTGKAGDIEITAEGGLTLQGRGPTGAGASLSAVSNANGNAGGIEIDAPSITVEQGAQISTVANAGGRAGDIRLNTETLTLSDGGEILASSSGSGDGGEIIIDAATAVNLGEGVQDFAPIISVETSGAGRAGNITINSPTFTLSETARITATATNTATNTEAGGSITLNASNMELAGVVGIFAETEGQAPAGTLTLQPFNANFDQGAPQFDPQLTLLLAPGSEISASTSGRGQGGGFQVFAPEAITIAGPGRLAVETRGPGDAGDIEIRTQRLTLTDGVEISASTFATSAWPGSSSQSGDNTVSLAGVEVGSAELTASVTRIEGEPEPVEIEVNTITGFLDPGDAGDINIFADNVNLTNGATVQTNTSGIGNAGNIEFNRNAGGIDLNAPSITVEQGAQISAVASADGRAGDIRLNTETLTLSDGGEILASSSGSGDGGEIIIDAATAVVLGEGVQDFAPIISVETSSAGRAGDIIINTPNFTLSETARPLPVLEADSATPSVRVSC